MSKKRVLITGVNGFTAGYFLDFLRLSGVDSGYIFGTDRAKDASGAHRCRFIKADLLDKKEALNVLKKSRPDLIFHFAGLNFGGDHNELMRGNVFTTNNLLEAVIKSRLKSRVLVIGSAAEYGISGAPGIPIKETAPLNPVTPYGVSKAAQTILALQYHSLYGLYVVIARPFNLIGPGQTPNLVCGSIVRQIKNICVGRRPSAKLIVGNLDSGRDFVDIRDAVRAYWLLLNSGKNMAGEVFNVASGRSTPIKRVLGILFKYCGKKIPVERRKEKIKRGDIKAQSADISKIKKAVGWKSSIGPGTSLKDMYESVV